MHINILAGRTANLKAGFVYFMFKYGQTARQCFTYISITTLACMRRPIIEHSTWQLTSSTYLVPIGFITKAKPTLIFEDTIRHCLKFIYIKYHHDSFVWTEILYDTNK